MLVAVGELLAADGLQARLTTFHPRMVAMLKRASERAGSEQRDSAWRVTRIGKTVNPRRVRGRGLAATDRRRELASSAGRMVVSARWTR
jgi:hypothetical protein